ncbi:recombinase family protein [Flagellimonas sp. CMM7]|uniref:recombinase family protein n=1 Tax=Flagellimonas sp. CMM7 TaxID=2654676 RepID=UPI0013D5BFB2|nr:recombinase family protein [Flagellimonas sp. CMM7]UII81502.1 recombinase family protein [Flagellimonas sp. CMM7]
MKAVIYIRVSTKEQDEQGQIDTLSSYAKSKGLNITKTFLDKVSGYKIEYGHREQFNEMQDYIDTNDIKCIVVSEISRIGRKLIETLKFIQHCTDKGICIHIVKDSIITINNDGTKNWMLDIMLPVLGSMAQMESEQLAYRVKYGLNNRYKDGRGFNARIVGYKRDSEGRPIIDPEQKHIVKDIFKQYLEHRSQYTVANYANNKYGHIKRFTEGGIRSMLRNEIYIGKWKIAEYVNEVEPIIPENLFYDVQDIMDNRKRTNLGNKHINPFAGILKCENCNTLMRQYVADKPQHRLNKYGCPNKKCNSKAVSRTHLIHQVKFILERYHKAEGFEKQKAKVKEKLTVLESNKNEIEKKIGSTKKRQDKLLDSMLDGTVPKEQYKSKNDDLESIKNRELNRLDTINIDIASAEKFLTGDIPTNQLESLADFKDVVQKSVKYVIVGEQFVKVKIKGGFDYILPIYRLGKLQKFNNGNLKMGVDKNVETDMLTLMELLSDNQRHTPEELQEAMRQQAKHNDALEQPYDPLEHGILITKYEKMYSEELMEYIKESGLDYLLND